MVRDLAVVVPLRSVAKAHRELEILLVQLGWVSRLHDDLASFRIPWLEVVEEVLLQGITQVAQRNLDLDALRAVAAVEVKIVREGIAGCVWMNDPAECLHDRRPTRPRLAL